MTNGQKTAFLSFTGEHIHLGYGSPPQRKDFLTAKSDFVHEMVRWGGLDRLPLAPPS